MSRVLQLYISHTSRVLQLYNSRTTFTCHTTAAQHSHVSQGQRSRLSVALAQDGRTRQCGRIQSKHRHHTVQGAGVAVWWWCSGGVVVQAVVKWLWVARMRHASHTCVTSHTHTHTHTHTHITHHTGIRCCDGAGVGCCSKDARPHAPHAGRACVRCKLLPPMYLCNIMCMPTSMYLLFK